MTLFIMIIISSVLCYKKGDWRHWKRYYPTILFYIIISMNESIITNKKPLWLFYGSASLDKIYDYFFEFIFFPSVIILFLSNYPKPKMKQMIYIISYTLLLSFSEYIFYLTKEIKYFNGWNLGCSILLYLAAFSLLILHDKHPLISWLTILMLIGGVMLYFKLPIMNLAFLNSRELIR